MRKMVELVEEKDHLVQQLEELRIMEKLEDSEINSVFSEKGFNLSSHGDITEKFVYSKDII